MNKYLVLGVTSAIGKTLVRKLAKDGNFVICCGRNLEEVKKISEDLRVRYNAQVNSYKYDALDLNSHNEFIKIIQKKHSDISTIIILHGYLGHTDNLTTTIKTINDIITINYSSVVSLTKAFIKYFPIAKTIAVVTSVAGDRGKRTNLHYNSAKAAASTYLEGLRKSTTHNVIDIKPGWVDTPMTYGSVNPILAASTEIIAEDIIKGIEKNTRVVYTPFFWKYVMFVLKHIPGKIFDKTKF